jgi:3-oxoacyl-[acyl-carrier-protein] synthase-3
LSNREFCFLVPESARPGGFNPETATDWIESRSGIRSRHVVDRKQIGKSVASGEVELNLSLQALKNFNTTAEEWQKVEAILCVRSAPINSMPGLSQKIHAKFCKEFNTPAKPVFTLDLVQQSTGMLQALSLARTLPYQNVWIIACEVLSPFLNLNDVGSSMLFGDAVAAVWLSSDLKAEFKILGEEFVSMPDTAEVLLYDDSPQSFRMKGPELFRKVAPEFKRSSERILKKLNLSIEKIQYFLPHQANSRIIERVAHSLGFTHDQIITNIAQVGNVSSASMMVALQDFLKTKDCPPGTLILMNACGAGLSAGAAVIEKQA